MRGALVAISFGLGSATVLVSQQHASKQEDFLKGEFSEEKMKQAKAMFESSSAQSEQTKFGRELSDMRQKAHGRKLSHNDALDMLKTKLSKEERQQMSLLMSSSHAKEDDKAMYVKAVTTLNDMYLSIDDERIRTITTCSVELYQSWMGIWGHWRSIHLLWMMIGEANSDVMKATEQRMQTETERQQEEEKLDSIKSAQSAVMEDLDKDLEAKQADVALYKFIIGSVEGSCKKDEEKEFLMQKKQKAVATPASAGKPLLLQSEKESLSTSCESQCAAQQKMGTNAMMLKVFSDPKVQDEAKKSLSKHAQHSLKETMKNIRETQREHVHDKYAAFLQKKSVDSNQPWVWNDGQGCGCGSIEDMECSTMLTLIGQELECNKQEMREKEGIITKQQEDDKKELEEQNDVLSSLDKTMENQNSVMMASENEKKQYWPALWLHWQKLINIWWTTREKRFDCYLRLFELENNYFCAIKHIRGYMKDLALEALDFPPEAIQDCQVEDNMFPTGDCLMPGGTEHLECMEGDTMPTDQDMLPTQDWTRVLLAGPVQDEKLTEAAGNVTLALACPDNILMNMACSRFLCPADCEVSEWGEFSTCTAECDSGFHQRTRQIVRTPRFGGAKCPDTSETGECNTHACDVDCVLHEDWAEEAGCLQACTYYGEERYEVVRKHVAEEAKGRGECPEKNHESRVMEVPCDSRQCRFDEVCSDVTDMVVAYECSAAVNKLGCWLMSIFIVELMKKIPTVSFGFPTMAISLVKFGNGMSKKVAGTKDSYYVQEAEILTPLNHNVKTVRDVVYKDTWQSWTGKNGWTYGFNNIGQALKQADMILDDSQRSSDSGVIADKKVLVLTKGKRAGCTVVKQVAEGMRKKGITIDVILFSPSYDSNPDEYSALQESVTFPYKAHLHNMGPFHQLVDWGFRMMQSQFLVAKMCPNAISKSHTLQKHCDMRVQLLHRGRTCHNWTKKLTSGPVTLEECRNQAFQDGILGFVWTDVSGQENAEESNCLTHEEDGKKAQVNEEKKPVENTCTYVPDYGKDKPDEHKGWLNQEIAAGNGETTSHYAVLQSAQDCPSAWSRTWQNYVFQYEFTPEKYFIK